MNQNSRLIEVEQLIDIAENNKYCWTSSFRLECTNCFIRENYMQNKICDCTNNQLKELCKAILYKEYASEYLEYKFSKLEKK